MKLTKDEILDIRRSKIEQQCCFNCVYANPERSDDCYEYCNILKEYVKSICKCKKYKKID